MNRNARGFTLIEMMVAIFIALIIFTIGFTAISSTIQARREAEARVRATESARLLFDLLSKDLASAYPVDSQSVNLITMAQETANQPISVNGKTVTVTNDRVEFFTRLDHRNVTDQYTFVRYFVNTKGHMCRQVNTSDTPANAFVAFDDTDDSSALFDQTFALLVSPCQWQDTAKSMTVSPSPPCGPGTTHLKVDVYMFGYSGANLAVDNSGPTKRVFSKTLAVPDVFRQLP